MEPPVIPGVIAVRLVNAAWVELIGKLLDIQRDQPGFADQFDEIVRQIVLRTKNTYPPVTMPLKDQAEAFAQALEEIDQMLAIFKGKVRGIY